MLQGITVGTYTVTGLVTGTTTSSPSVAQGNVDDFDLDTLSSGYTYPIQTVLFGGQNFVSTNGSSPDFFLFEAGSGDPDDVAVTPIFPDGSLGTAVNLPTTVNPAGWGDTGYRMVSQQAGQWIMGVSWDITDMKDAAGSKLSPSAVIKGIRITQIAGGLDPCGFFAAIGTPSSDLSGNGKVDMEDVGLLSQGWHNDYEMADLLRIAEDWLLITNVAFQSDPIIEMDAVEGIAYSSTLSDNLVAFDASQLSFSKLNGSGWLTVAADGALSGTPSASDVSINNFTVRVESQSGSSDQATLVINVHGISSPYSIVDFDPSGELMAQFSSGGYTESALGGLNGSVGVSLGHGAVATLDGTQSCSNVFSAVADAIRAGTFFKMTSFGTGTGAAGGQILHLGLTKGGSDDFTNLPFATIELTGTAGSGQAHLVERYSASIDADTFTLTTNQWYYFETRFIYRGGTAVDYDMTVYTASSDGSIGSILSSYATSQHQDNPELDDGAALYGGFSGGTAFDNGAAAVIDNFYVSDDSGWVIIYPQVYPYALRNPLKGFRPGTSAGSSYSGDPYATVTRCYLKWNEIENYESDTIDKIKTVCNTKWKDAEKYNVKVIPRVYLDWDSDPNNEYWPADMTKGDYSSEQFKTRLRRLIQRLGQCWNNDPRVAWVQMGIIGWWGEQETPWPSAEIQQLMGDEFTAAFPNKKVLVRRPKDAFTNYPFGGYLDSWANWNKETTDGAAADYLNTNQARWKVNVWEGECAYNCCGYQTQPGDSPDDTLTDPVHRNFLIDTIRKRHCSALGWVSGYTKSNPVVAAGAEEVQRAFGYRYLLNEVRYPDMLTPGAEFSVQFKVTNVGSAPICYNWPVEVSLLNPTTKAVVWNDTFDGCDIRNWLSGDQYNSTTRTYTVPAVANTVSGTFQLPGSIANGEYILALAILDPSGNLPSVRFATINYFNGGRHPIGKTGVGTHPGQYQLSPSVFNDPAADKSLYYVK
jgi:hypothetical protein